MARLAKTSSGALLDRVLARPDLVALVQALEPPVLRRLVEHVGLEDAGEVVALATTEQLERVLDEDLWRAASAGADEELDPERFGLWLEVLLEAGEEVAIAKLRAMDEDLLALGLSRNVTVIDVDAMAQRMSSGSRDDDDDLVEKALESALSIELEEFRVMARVHAHFDAIAGVLAALDRDDHALLRRLLERCAAATEARAEDEGLYEVLTEAESLAEDVAGARADRREAEGYVAPADARAFLALARQTAPDALLAETKPDPITRAHLRALRPAPPRPAPSPRVEAFLRELAQGGVLPKRARPLLLEANAAARHTAFDRAMAELRAHDPVAFGARLAELAYLVNVLVAGAAFDGRAFRPAEAAELAALLCAVGLARDPKADLAKDGAAVRLFRVGWRVAARDAWDRAGIDDLRAELVRR